MALGLVVMSGLVGLAGRVSASGMGNIEHRAFTVKATLCPTGYCPKLKEPTSALLKLLVQELREMLRLVHHFDELPSLPLKYHACDPKT